MIFCNSPQIASTMMMRFIVPSACEAKVSHSSSNRLHWSESWRSTVAVLRQMIEVDLVLQLHANVSSCAAPAGNDSRTDKLLIDCNHAAVTRTRFHTFASVNASL
jgi:hypothetical protein